MYSYGEADNFYIFIHSHFLTSDVRHEFVAHSSRMIDDDGFCHVTESTSTEQEEDSTYVLLSMQM